MQDLILDMKLMLCKYGIIMLYKCQHIILIFYGLVKQKNSTWVSAFCILNYFSCEKAMLLIAAWAICTKLHPENQFSECNFVQYFHITICDVDFSHRFMQNAETQEKFHCWQRYPISVYFIVSLKCKCSEGDSFRGTPTGIQCHRLRALFGESGYGNTPEQICWNRHIIAVLGRYVSRVKWKRVERTVF